MYENAEINNLIKIIGLQYKKKYQTEDDLKTLRYGKVMIMTDQDQVNPYNCHKTINVPRADTGDITAILRFSTLCPYMG